MILSNFLNNLLEKGSVTIENKLVEFSREDLRQSTEILEEYYQRDKLEMPFNAPDFSKEAALWAAIYLYNSVQLSMLRNIEADDVKNRLKDFSGEINPSNIYSADLSLRYISHIFDFIKGLAPDDILVRCLKSTASKWSFSSVGIELEETPDIEIIFMDNSLKFAYIDRIIKYNDFKRIKDKRVKELIESALGNYTEELWGEFLYRNKSLNG